MMDTVKRRPNEKKSRDHTSKMLARIKKDHRRGRMKNADQATRTYLSSHDSKFVACLKAADAMERLGKSRPPKKVIEQIAGEIDPWKGTNEKVKLYIIQKSGNENEFRPIMSFGLENRALQHLVLPILEARSELQPNQYLSRGGTPAAIKAVVEALEAGYNYVAELDIEACFTNFDAEKLPGLLPLPKEVTTHVIASAYLNLTPGNFLASLGPCDWSDLNELQNNSFIGDVAAVWRGIPQGSTVSPLVAENLLSTVVSQPPDKGVVINYADNLLAMGREGNDTVALVEALRCALDGHPAGPLKPSWIKTYGPGETIEFLGYSIHRNGSKCRVVPSVHNMWKFRRKFAKWRSRIIATPDPAKATRGEILRLAKYVRSWTGGFPVWDEAGSYRQKYLGRVATVAQELGIAVDIK